MITRDPIQSSTPQTAQLQNLQPNISVGNSILVLISPREQQNHFHRPLVYNFQPSVLDSITEHIIDKPTALNNVDRVLNQCPDINMAIVPGHTGFEMKTSYFSNSWQFFLVIDDAANAIISNRLSNRTVMLGLCSDEPISQHGLHSATPEQFLNPNCRLIVTRQISFNQMDKLTPQGMQSKTELMNDTNIANFNKDVYGDPMVMNDNFFAMSPDKAYNSATIGDDNALLTTMNLEDSLNVKGSDRISSSLESPRRHLKEIIRACESGVTHSMYEGTISSYGDASARLGDSSNEMLGYIGNALEDSCRLNVNPQGSGPADLIGTEYLTLGALLSRYHPRVIPITVPRTTDLDIIPQNINCPNTIYSSLVCSVIPSYMNAIGLSAVGFMYNSYHDAIQVLHIEPTIACSDDEMKVKWKSFEYLLRKELNPVLMTAGGHFDISVMSSLNSTTDCVLNFLDFTPFSPGSIYREETILGGTLSPLVGTGQDVVRNGYQLNQLFNQVSAYSDLNNNRMY